MISSGQEGSTCRRPQSRGVKVVVPQPVCCEPLGRRHSHAAAKAARNAEAHVVYEDDDYIGCSFGRAKHCLFWGFGISRIKRNRSSISLIGNRQDLPAYAYILCHWFSPFSLARLTL